MTLALLVIGVFMVVVLVHELGHFWLARRNGVKVEEFGVGFPPRLFGRQMGETFYSVNLLPLGGFVKLKGENSADKSPNSLGAASFAAKAKILLAGVGMNLVLGYVLLLGLCLTGLPPLLEGQFTLGNPTLSQPKQVMVVKVSEESPAKEAGLKTGDVIKKVNGREITEEAQLLEFTKSQANQEVSLEVNERAGQSRQVNVRLNDEEEAKAEGYLGITPFQTFKLRYGWEAPIVALGLLGQMVWGTLAGLASLVAQLVVGRNVADGVTGPVGIVSILGNLRHFGVAYLASFVVSISVSLAVLNALPIPALDGGRLALAVWQKVSGEEISPRREGQIHGIGFALLMILFLVITYIDVQRLRQ
jgi:regulator of sigma E protease